MSRVKRGVTKHARHKKVLEAAKGFRGRHSKAYKPARNRLEKAMQYTYRDRRLKKREFRSLWIVRIGAAAKLNGMSYSQFIHGLKKSGVELDRKILSDLAVHDPGAFKSLAQQAKGALGGAA